MGNSFKRVSASREICSASTTASLRPLRKYPDQPEEGARGDSLLLALRQARAASRGERDFRKDRADGVRRKGSDEEEVEEDDEEEAEEGEVDCGEGGEVEKRLEEVAE